MYAIMAAKELKITNHSKFNVSVCKLISFFAQTKTIIIQISGKKEKSCAGKILNIRKTIIDFRRLSESENCK